MSPDAYDDEISRRSALTRVVIYLLDQHDKRTLGSKDDLRNKRCSVELWI